MAVTLVVMITRALALVVDIVAPVDG